MKKYMIAGAVLVSLVSPQVLMAQVDDVPTQESDLEIMQLVTVLVEQLKSLQDEMINDLQNENCNEEDQTTVNDDGTVMYSCTELASMIEELTGEEDDLFSDVDALNLQYGI